MRYFKVVTFAEHEVQDYLDLLIFVANPSEKNTAHITIGGPYETLVSADRIEGSLIGTKISVLGVGNFFKDGQNTVFFRCNSEHLQRYWDKDPFYAVPHITIYDGTSRSFAEKIFSALESHRLFFWLTVGQVSVLSSVRGQKDFRLWFEINRKKLEIVTGENIELTRANLLEEWQRISIIERICPRLIYAAQHRELYRDRPLSERIFR